MSYCCVPGCNSYKRREKDKTLSFHRFPTDTRLRREWISKIRRDIGTFFQITSNTKVCSKHFPKECFVHHEAGKTCLLPGSVPQLFAWTKSCHIRSTRTREESYEPAGETEYASVDLAGVDTDADVDQAVKPAPYPDHDYAEPSQSLEEQLEAARQEISRLTQENTILKASRFSLKRFQNDSKMLTFYTGFRDYETLRALFLSLQPTAEGMLRWNQAQKMVKQDKTPQEMARVGFRAESLGLFDQFFLFLCRVREGALEESLAERFHVSQSTVSRILITWANYLFFMLGSLPIWLHRSAVDAIMPQCFKDTFPRTRVILDCTEIYIERASSKVINSETYSNYKGSTTLKGLIGVCPSGEITFVSSLYEGSISDKQITKQSGILSLLEEGDEVMADKGFLIGDMLSPINASLVVPPFLNQRRQFTREEVTTTQQIARLRIHVERAIGRIKQHHVFDGVLPLSLLGTVNQLWFVCAMLTNFQGPLF